jgi:SAM-dependent methyltransferase
VAAIVLRRLGSERIADVVRWADQRLELFSPRGAGLYARFAVPLLAPLYQRVAKEVAAVAPDTVLDVGTGPGALALEIAERCGSCSVIGVDLAPEMLATAEKRASDARVADRVTFGWPTPRHCRWPMRASTWPSRR